MSCFVLKAPVFGQKNENCLFKMKFDTKTFLKMLSSMIMFKFSILNQKYPFWANLVQKGEIAWLRWNLVKQNTKIFFPWVWRSQNEAGVKNVHLKWETFKKCHILLFYIINYKRKLVRLIANICQCEVDNITFLNSTFCMPHKNKTCTFNVHSSVLKKMLFIISVINLTF